MFAARVGLLGLLFGGWFGGPRFESDDFLVLSGTLSPEVRLAVRQEAQGYRVRVEAQNPYAGATARLGLAAGRSAVEALDRLPAERVIPFEAVGGTNSLRLALEVSWFNADGKLRQREVFRAPSIGGRLPNDPGQWEAFDYAGYRERVADLARRIRIPVRQPMEGKLSVVIEREDGQRVRNLVSGQDAAAGRRVVEWDGRDEVGNWVAPGTYRFRAASHPGITPEFKMQFANGGESFLAPFGSNHGVMTALAANSSNVFAAASITEGGWAIIALRPDGAFARGYRQVGGAGIEEVALAADERRLYVLNDGGAWCGLRDAAAITLTVYDIATGDIVPPKGGKGQFAVVRERKAQTPAANGEKAYALAGAAYAGGRLWVSDREKGAVLIVDPESGGVAGEIELPQAGPLAADGGRLIAASGDRLVSIDPESRAVTPLAELPFAPRGLCIGKEGVYATGAGDDTVGVFGRDGRRVRTLGEPGGAYAGAWRPERLVNPAGVALAPDGALWVAENRRNPKRLSKWDPASGRCVYEKVGCPSYGSPGAGFDSEQPSRWLGQRCLWNVDLTNGTARIVGVLQRRGGHVQGKIEECLNYRFVHRGGRTFVLGMFKGTLISELMPDGSLRDLALISDVHSLFYGLDWKYVPAYCDTVEKRFSKARRERQYIDESCRYVGVLWVDKNGNGDFDADEFQFLPEGSHLGSFGWGAKLNDLELRLPYRAPDQREGVLTLRADAFNAAGAPEYSFEKALAQFAPLRDELPQGSRTVLDTVLDDARGNAVVNTDPFMFSLAENGAINWFFPNRWTNVHGSHNAPMPRPGEMQGVLFGLGSAPLDKQGDAMVFAGNHGRFFLMTTDGIYLDEMFQDCRVAEVAGPGLIGGEAFGGVFDYDRVNKRYLLQAGNSGYRIYQINGLDRIVRSEGKVKVTAEMLAASARRSRESAREESGAKVAALPRRLFKERPDFGGLPVAAEWASGNWRIRVRGAYDERNLYLAYEVDDPSPWVNNGKDWTQLFKTGDAVDLQLGTDPSASADRKGAAPGDVRLLIAPFNGQPLAVRYRYRLKDKTGAAPVEFASPWRSERVDDVGKLSGAEIRVQTWGEGYRVEAALPLVELGLGSVAGQALRGDFGVIYGDRQGTVNLSRVYWSNPATGLVNDVPGETMLSPDLWGSVKFGE